MRTDIYKFRIASILIMALSLSACLMDEDPDVNSPSSIDGLSISIENYAGASTIQTPDIAVNITGTVSSREGIDSVSWLNDRGGKGNASGKENWVTGNIVLQLGTNKITVTAKDLAGKTVSNTLTVERENTTITPSDNSEPNPVVMYSYNSDLSSAAPVKGASINPQTVYIFVVPGSDWENRGFADIKIRCCKGMAGPGEGESFFAQVTVRNSPWANLYDMSGFASGGTRRVKIWAAFNDGSLSANHTFDFTVAGTAESTNRAPSISGSPSTKATVGNQYNFRPQASDPDGDTMSFSVANKPAWATFNKSTGRLFGTPGANDVGTYSSITIRVSDGSTTAKLASFSISVEAFSNGNANLTWTIPTQRTDNTSLNNLAGFNIYYGQTAGDYGNVIKLSNAGLDTYVVDNLSSGTWYFVVTAKDADGLESNPSNRSSKTF